MLEGSGRWVGLVGLALVAAVGVLVWSGSRGPGAPPATRTPGAWTRHGGQQRPANSTSNRCTAGVPAVVGVGCHKCGTTTLARLLTKVPWAQMSRRKELRYFTGQHVKGYEAYRAWWDADVPRNMCAYEISPRYLAHDKTAWEMARVIPHWQALTLLLLLRDPVARTLSHYFNQFSRPDSSLFQSPMGFEEVVRLELELFASCPRPALQEPWPSCATRLTELQEWGMCRSAALTHQSLRISDSGARATYVAWMRQNLVASSMFDHQVYNFVCAGFRPDQFLVFFTHEFADEPAVLREMAVYLGQSAVPAAVLQQLQASPLQAAAMTRGHNMSEATHAALMAFFAPHNAALSALMQQFMHVRDLLPRFHREFG